MCAVGKASIAFARALERGLEGAEVVGIAVVPHGTANGHGLRTIRVLDAGHPVPDEAGVAAVEEVLALVDGSRAEDVVVVAVSGGGSALLPALPTRVPLEDWKITTSRLLGCGADIRDINTVRSALSRVASGRLADRARPARCVGLVLSDVPGDDLSLVASGPTVASGGDAGSARRVLERLGLWSDVPASIRDALRTGSVPEAREAAADTFLVGSNRQALEAAATTARTFGYEVTINAGPLVGEARAAGVRVAEAALASSGTGRRCLLWGGETTVEVRGSGRGGRNQEVALSAACRLDGASATISILAAGTDGRDGPTPAAGALVDTKTCARARSMGIDGRGSLDANDSYGFFERVGGLVVTGPTHTNVMDLTVALVG